MKPVGVILCIAVLAAQALGSKNGIGTALATAGPGTAAIPVTDRTSCSGSVATVMTNLTGDAADAVEALGAKYHLAEGVRAVVFDGREAILVVSPETYAEWKRTASDVRVAASCVPTALETAARRAAEEQAVGPKGFSAVGYDALSDRIQVITTEPANDVATAVTGNGYAGARTAVAEGTLMILDANPGDFGAATRTNDGPPHWGGVWFKGPSTSHCTTGFYINSSNFGTVMVTAGHCFGGNGQTVKDSSGANVQGVSEGWSANDPDLALIDGESYYRRSYSWNDQSSNKLISGKNTPQAGVTYCQMGSTSLRVCAWYKLLNVDANYAGRNVHHLNYAEGPAGPGGSLGAAGDSGGGVFRELDDGTLSARGIVVATGCNASVCSRWDHTVNTVESHYNGTVVTSG